MLMAEMKALIYGLRFAKQLGLKCTVIEEDILQIINIANNKALCPWKLYGLYKEVLDVAQDGEFNHCYREVNELAHWLAKMGSLQAQGSVALKLKPGTKSYGYWKMDKLGVPAFRRRV